VTCVVNWVASVTVCCSVLQRVAVWCSVLQCVAACCSVLQRVAVCCSVMQRDAACCSVLQRVAVCCSVLQCVALTQLLTRPGYLSSSQLTVVVCVQTASSRLFNLPHTIQLTLEKKNNIPHVNSNLSHEQVEFLKSLLCSRFIE